MGPNRVPFCVFENVASFESLQQHRQKEGSFVCSGILLVLQMLSVFIVLQTLTRGEKAEPHGNLLSPLRSRSMTAVHAAADAPIALIRGLANGAWPTARHGQPDTATQPRPASHSQP